MNFKDFLLKKIPALVLTGVSAVSLAACGGGGAPTGSSSESSSGGGASKKGSITIAVPMTSEEKEILQSVVDEYRKINPLVSISIDTSGSSGGYYDRLNSMLSNSDMSKVTADIVRNNMASQYFGSNKFVDFAPYLQEENPYADNEVWSSVLNPIALQPNGSKGQIYSLSFQSTQVSFFYNKQIFEECGINADELLKWNDFVEALEIIENHYSGENDVIPLGINGSASSFWSGQMSWIIRTYTDQYFRSVADEVHTQTGDYNYDPIKDGAWSYGANVSDYPTLSQAQAEEAAWFNDDARTYTQNELRLLQGINSDTYGPITEKYKSMLANLREVFPKYCGDVFTSDDSSAFWAGKCAIALDETALLVSWKNRCEISPETAIDVGYFPFPAMEAHEDYPNATPDVDYTRSIGGPHGYYGVINKSAKQTDLVMDFMMFWISKQGQDVEMAKHEELGIAIKGVPYVLGVNVPDSINLVKDMTLRGIVDFNPAMTFARGLSNEAQSTRDFQNYTQRLFVLENLSIDDYGSLMQASLKKYMPNYLENRGYRANALENGNVSVSPF